MPSLSLPSAPWWRSLSEGEGGVVDKNSSWSLINLKRIADKGRRQRTSATYTLRARMPGDQRSRAQSRWKRGRTEAELSKAAAGGRCGSSSAAVWRSSDELCPAQKSVSRIVSRDGAWAGWKGPGCESEPSQQRAEHPECEEHVQAGEQDGAHPASGVLEGRRTATVNRRIIPARIILSSVSESDYASLGPARADWSKRLLRRSGKLLGKSCRVLSKLLNAVFAAELVFL